MPKKKAAKIEFVKAAAGVSFVTLAAIGSTTGNPVLAGLSAIPAASLASYDAVRDQLGWFKTQKEKTLEIHAPSWWRRDIQAWQNLCTEIEQHLPDIFLTMQRNMQQEQQILTGEIVQQIFVDALAAEPLTCISTLEDKKRIGEFLAPSLLQKIEEVLKPVVEHLQQEGALIDTRKIVSHTEQVVQVLEQIHTEIVQANEPLSLSKEESMALHQRYSQALYTQWKMLDFKGIIHFDMNHPISIPLIDVFVFPDVQVGVPEYETLERDSEYFLLLNHPRQRARRVIRQREALQEALVKHRRLVVLGDPGSGKSTLLRYLLLQLVQGVPTFAATFPLLSDEAACVPLYMPLAAYAEVFLTSTPGTRSLEDFLPIYLRDNYLSDYVDFLQEQLRQGNVVFLFDGLDEIPDAALRMKVVNHIERFTQSHTANRFLVTSRIVGYKEAPLSASEYQVYTLADFNEEQVKTFTQHWCPAYERWVNGFSESQHLEDAATKEAQKLFYATQSKPAVKRLAVNPLLLTILALIQRQGIDLPSHRIELYRLCTETLIDTWVKAKGQSIQFSKNELVRILRPLAFWMHEHAAVGAIPQEELHEQIVRQLVERTLNEYEAHRQAEQFLQIVRGKTGILVERGKERYGFLHLTFEEYFTARAVELRKDRGTFIKKHLHDPRWREVILLTVGSVGIIQNDEEQVTELVRTIADANSPYEWALHRDLLFTGHCLADDIGVLPAYENELIQRIMFLYLTSPHDGLRMACSSVLTAWSGTKVAEKAVQLVQLILQQWVFTTGTKKAFVAQSPFEKKVAAELEQLSRQHQRKITNYLHFDIIIILAALQMHERVDWQSQLVDLFTSEDVKLKIVTLLEAGHSDQHSLIAAFIAGLADPNAEVRKKMISTLGRLASRQSGLSDDLLSALSDAALFALSDADFSVQKTVTALLVQLGKIQPSIIDALLASLEKENVRKDAILDALGKIGEGHSAVIDTLLLALTDVDDGFVSVTAARALAKISQGEPYVIDALLIALTDHDEYIADAAVHSLGRIYNKKNYDFHRGTRSPMLSELTTIADPDVDVLQVTAKALGKLGSDPPRITDRLLLSLTNAQKAKKIATNILGYLGKGHPHVPDTLLSIVLDMSTTHETRKEAIGALANLGEKKPRVVDALLHILASSSGWSMKRAAVSALGQLGDNQPRVVETLLDIFADTHADNRVKRAALHALRQLGDSQPHILDTLLSALSTSSWSLKTEIITVLVCLGGDEPHVIEALLSTYKEQPRLINTLLWASFSPDPRTQAAVMHFFEQQGKDQPEMIDVLLVALTDGDQSTREYARDMLIHLCEIYPHRTHDLVVALSRTDLILEATEEYQRRIFGIVTSRVINVLEGVKSDHPNSVNAMFTALYDDDAGIGRAAARALVQLSKRRIDLLEKLLRALPETDWQTQCAAADVFFPWSEEQGKQSVIDLFLFWLSDAGHVPVRHSALRALGQVGKGQTRVIESLLAACSDPYEFMRREIARTLGLLGKGHPQVIDALLQMLSDRVGSVRYDAAIALGTLGEMQPRIIDALVQVLYGTSSLGRDGAYRALRQLGKEQPQIIETLLSALSSSDDTIRAAAARTIMRENEDVRIIAALLQATYDADRRVREAAAFTLASAQSDSVSIGTRIEELLRQCEQEAGNSSLLFHSLQDIAEKTGMS